MENQELLSKIKSIKSRIEKLIGEGHLDEAKSALAKYEEKAPGDPDICSMMAVVHIIEGDIDKAEHEILRGLAKDTVQFDLLYNLAYIYELKNELAKAADLYLEAASVTDSDEMKNNVTVALERIKAADDSITFREKDKIVFFVRDGMNNFFEDIIKGLSDEYWVRKISVYDFKQIDAGMEWADVCWFEWCDDLIVYGSRLPLAKTKKIICRLHRYEAFTDKPGKVMWENVDKLILVTEHLKDLLEMNHPGVIDRVDTVVIENGVDVNRYQFMKRKRGFNIAMVGYIHSRKNPVMLLQIIQKLVQHDKRYKLYVAGQFQEQLMKLYWEYQITRMGLSDNVIFDGWQNDISKWLEDKNYLLSASIHESFGYGIAEAMARGIKPVIHDFLYAYEIWDEQFLFNTVDEAVDAILSDDYDSQKYRDFIISNYSLEKQLFKTKKLIDEMLSAKRIVFRVRDILENREQPEELKNESITVLIPNYNRARMIKEDLDNGLKLGDQYKVIVDDCSTAETEWLDQISESDKRSKVIRKAINSGVAESRKTGLDAIESKYTTFIDDDNMMICLDREAAEKDISELQGNVSVVVPRYIVNYYRDKLSLGYDRRYYDDKSGAQVLKSLAKTGEMMGLLTGGAIGDTKWMAGHASCPMFRVSEDFVMLARMMADKHDVRIKVTEGLVFVRRFLDDGSTLNRNITKLALELVAQAVACYYCLKLEISEREEVLNWMKDRASLIEKLYNFGDSFETEMIAYLTGEISEEVFIHFLDLHGIKIEKTLDELAPELKKMRGLLYAEPDKTYSFHDNEQLPLVSVIIPTFNRRDMLKKAIDQVLKQDYPNIEVIVTDNCSEDGTEEMVRSRYKDDIRVIYHRNETNIGPAANFRNAFYNLCRGEYCIGLCDDDYFIDGSYISRAINKFLSNPNIAFVYSGIYYHHMIEKKVYRVKPKMPELVEGMDLFINFTSDKYPNMPNPSSLVFKRENAIKVNAFSENPNRMSSDLLFELKLLLTGDACFDDGIVLVYRLHDGSMSRNTDMSIVDVSADKISKAVESARADIAELYDIIALAERIKNIDAKTADKWLTYRIWKYMYWRVNETAVSVNECKALLDFLEREYKPLYASLKQVAVDRFGKDSFAI